VNVDGESPVELAKSWSKEVVAVLKTNLETLGDDLHIDYSPLTSEGMQWLLRVRGGQLGAPEVEVVVEAPQAILDVDGLSLSGVLYEFDGRPDELSDRLSGAIESQDLSAQVWLSEVDLVNHVLGCLLHGYSYIRFPFYDRLRIPRFGLTAALDWGSFDLGWPPILIKKWKA
jgi:hypothetical protein